MGWLVAEDDGCFGVTKVTFFLFESVLTLGVTKVTFAFVSFLALESLRRAFPCALAFAALSCSLAL